MESKRDKWMRFEKKWNFREFWFRKILRRHIYIKYFNREPVMPFYAHKIVMGQNKTNDYIADKIRSGEPFFAGRFGNTELSIITSVLKKRIVGSDTENDERLNEWFYRSLDVSGLFPADISMTERFTDTYLEACKQVDLLAMWHLHMEDYMIEEYLPQVKLTHLLRLEPWLAANPWSAALEGKKILVIHPFTETIAKQYEKRNLIYPDGKVLPEFELKLLKAVQTSGGAKDERFKDWFEALDYMYAEAIKIDFDIAIIGCGAYGFPLAARLKEYGKQAIHLAGATQLLFGIKGKRWEENYPSKIATLFNDAWVYPAIEERPQNAGAVEDGCYWG